MSERNPYWKAIEKKYGKEATKCENCAVVGRAKLRLIEEFLRDWRWGNAIKHHNWNYSSPECKCPHHPEFWKWFEKKWEERKDD